MAEKNAHSLQLAIIPVAMCGVWKYIVETREGGGVGIESRVTW